VKRVVLAPEAKADLDLIWSYVAKQTNPDIAELFVSSITARFVTISQMPGIGRARPDFGPGISSFPADEYLIYYRKTSKGAIRISRVIHGKRDQLAAWTEE
jgi:toxin ParE1/3/4